MDRAAYIGWRTAVALAETGSQLVNAAVFGGSTHQTLSARAHIDPDFVRMQRRIDWFFRNLPFWKELDHCASAWMAEVDRARRTLDRAGVLS